MQQHYTGGLRHEAMYAASAPSVASEQLRMWHNSQLSKQPTIQHSKCAVAACIFDVQFQSLEEKCCETNSSIRPTSLELFAEGELGKRLLRTENNVEGILLCCTYPVMVAFPALNTHLCSKGWIGQYWQYSYTRERRHALFITSYLFTTQRCDTDIHSVAT